MSMTKFRPDTRSRRDVRDGTTAARYRVIALIGAALLLCIGLFCGRAMYVGWVAHDALAEQAALPARLARADHATAVRETQQLGASLRRWQALDPNDPAVAEWLGGVYTITARGAPTAEAAAVEWKAAHEQYSMAVVLRPTSPYAWANRAWARYHLGLLDAQFYAALENAIRLGPWEREVQLVVVDLGLGLWPVMPSDLRLKVLGMVQRGQRRYAQNMVDIAARYGRLAEVCTFERLATLPACKAAALSANTPDAPVAVRAAS